MKFEVCVCVSRIVERKFCHRKKWVAAGFFYTAFKSKTGILNRKCHASSPSSCCITFDSVLGQLWEGLRITTTTTDIFYAITRFTQRIKFVKIFVPHNQSSLLAKSKTPKERSYTICPPVRFRLNPNDYYYLQLPFAILSSPTKTLLCVQCMCADIYWCYTSNNLLRT